MTNINKIVRSVSFFAKKNIIRVRNQIRVRNRCHKQDLDREFSIDWGTEKSDQLSTDGTRKWALQYGKDTVESTHHRGVFFGFPLAVGITAEAGEPRLGCAATGRRPTPVLRPPGRRSMQPTAGAPFHAPTRARANWNTAHTPLPLCRCRYRAHTHIPTHARALTLMRTQPDPSRCAVNRLASRRAGVYIPM